ncbi:MAG: hypothetical protein JWO05_1330 [Gemmatimonadetes bacterium]|nr:hypothetical protein [Gemmatimonadota bacterium]
MLLGVTEPPGYGGGASAAYGFFRRLCADGLDAHLLNMLDERDEAYYRFTFGEALGNTAQIPTVRPLLVHGLLTGSQPAIARAVREVDPDLLVAFGYHAALLLCNAAGDIPVVFITQCCRLAQDHVSSGYAGSASEVREHLAQGNGSPLVNRHEREAVRRASLVLTHSPMTLSLMQQCYPREVGRIFPTPFSFGKWISDDARVHQGRARPFAERDIDVVLIASNWSRREKNWPWVEALAKALPMASIHVVGEVPREIPGVTHHGFLASREDVMSLLGRARCVACPSLIDAAPGVLFEGSVMGCNLVASANCGNSELCNPALLVAPFTTSAFVERVRLAIKAPLADRSREFDMEGDHSALVGVLEAAVRAFVPLHSPGEPGGPQ